MALHLDQVGQFLLALAQDGAGDIADGEVDGALVSVGDPAGAGEAASMTHGAALTMAVIMEDFTTHTTHLIIELWLLTTMNQEEVEPLQEVRDRQDQAELHTMADHLQVDQELEQL